ncbi:MAG: hypothetical protein IJZ72_00395 [Oscillospiraceae bacterium]|nr:hypothetical protein [Oscillospiraceae bacterium]
MKLGEKVSYLKGLMEGLEVNESTKEGKILALMSDILQDMALAFEDVQDQIDEIVEVVDIIDEDLGNVEEELYGDCCCEDDDCDCDDDCCDCCDDDDELYEVCCPTCGDTIQINEAMLEEGSIICPGCGENLEFDFDEDEEDIEE